jgi:hypothetical protein
VRQVRGDDELTRFLEVLQGSGAVGVDVQWFWEESPGRFMAHEEKNRRPGNNGSDGQCWVRYSAIVAAQLEYFYQRLLKSDNRTPVPEGGAMSVEGAAAQQSKVGPDQDTCKSCGPLTD